MAKQPSGLDGLELLGSVAQQQTSIAEKGHYGGQFQSNNNIYTQNPPYNGFTFTIPQGSPYMQANMVHHTSRAYQQAYHIPPGPPSPFRNVTISTLGRENTSTPVPIPQTQNKFVPSPAEFWRLPGEDAPPEKKLQISVEPKPASIPKKRGEKTSAKRGRGARSGSNRRVNGTSDDDISELDAAQSKAAALKILKKPDMVVPLEDVSDDDEEAPKSRMTEDDRIAVVTYITSDKVWPTFKLKQNAVMVDVSQICSVMPILTSAVFTKDPQRQIYTRASQELLAKPSICKIQGCPSIGQANRRWRWGC